MIKKQSLLLYLHIGDWFCNFPGNLPQVTGASKNQLLGDIHKIS